jgi:hypothetical protein
MKWAIAFIILSSMIAYAVLSVAMKELECREYGQALDVRGSSLVCVYRD